MSRPSRARIADPPYHQNPNIEYSSPEASTTLTLPRAYAHDRRCQPPLVHRPIRGIDDHVRGSRGAYTEDR